MYIQIQKVKNLVKELEKIFREQERGKRKSLLLMLIQTKAVTRKLKIAVRELEEMYEKEKE